MSMLGALVLANMFALTGSTGCADEQDPVVDDELGTSSSASDSTTESSTESSTSGELTDSEDSVDSVDSSGVSFYAGPSPDGWGAPDCDPFAQDCPEGEKCVPYGSTGGNWDANKCVPVLGDGKPGDPCIWDGILQATDDCDSTSICWDVMDVEGQNVGTCTPFCTGTADAPICDPGTACLISNDDSITVCLDLCDPLLQDCGAGLGCFWAYADFICIFTSTDVPTGEPCGGSFNECAAGNFCADASALPACDGSACCTPFCDLADPVCSLS